MGLSCFHRYLLVPGIAFCVQGLMCVVSQCVVATSTPHTIKRTRGGGCATIVPPCMNRTTTATSRPPSSCIPKKVIRTHHQRWPNTRLLSGYLVPWVKAQPTVERFRDSLQGALPLASLDSLPLSDDMASESPIRAVCLRFRI